jgi:hypothetical protein
MRITIEPTADVRSAQDEANSFLNTVQLITTSGLEIQYCNRTGKGGYKMLAS